MTPYYQDSLVTIYHGDCRELLPSIDCRAVSCVVADPPYGETSLQWDRWPDGWVDAIAFAVPRAASFWCFGSMRLFLARRAEFARWQFAQEIVWEKHNGSGFAADRFKRVHEFATHWYRGLWADVHKAPVTTPDATARTVRRKVRTSHMGHIEVEATPYASEDGGPRLMRSVIYCRSVHGHAQNETQKPVGIVEPLITYSARPGIAMRDSCRTLPPGSFRPRGCRMIPRLIPEAETQPKGRGKKAVHNG